MSPFSTASTPVSVGTTLYRPRPMNSMRTALGQHLLDVEHRRGIREVGHADGLDVGRQERAAARERVAAALRGRSTRSARIRADRRRMVSSSDHDVHERPWRRRPCTVLPPVCALTAESARAASRKASSRRPAGHGACGRAPCRSPARARRSRRPSRRLVERRPGRGDDASLVAQQLPQLLGRVRRERRQHQDQRLDGFRSTASVSGRCATERRCCFVTRSGR